MQRKSQSVKNTREVRKAKVMYSTGGTINLGNYESSKFAIGLELECLESEIDQCFKKIKGTVDAMALRHIESVRGGSDE